MLISIICEVESFLYNLSLIISHDPPVSHDPPSQIVPVPASPPLAAAAPIQ